MAPRNKFHYPKKLRCDTMAHRAQERLETIFRHLKPFGNEDNIQIQSHNTYNIADGASFRYRYTRDNPLLTPLQRQFYEENGFLVIKKLVPDHCLDVYRDRFIDICDGRVTAPGLTIMKDIELKNSNLKGQDVVNKIQDLNVDHVLFEYCCLPQILDYAECFTGPNIMAMHSMLVNKPPDRGSMTSRHPLHQDIFFFSFRPAHKFVCSWTAMERVNRQNGCLVVVPGSHKGEILDHDYPNWEGGANKLYLGITNFSKDLPRVYLEMDKGDTVFFHPTLIHGSGANKTRGYRKAISCHFAASECEYIDDKGTNSEKFYKEVIRVANKRGLFLKSLAEVLEFRGRLVRGKKINL